MKEKPNEGFRRPYQQWQRLYFADLSCKFHFENWILKKNFRAQITDQSLITPRQDEFETFLKNFELTLDKIHENNPFMTIVLGDFNAKFNDWRKADITSLEGSKIDTVANSYGLIQLIQEPTHILNSWTSCIDLIFTSQPNLVIESGIPSLLHSNCHDQIVFAKFKFNLSIFYPPPYERTVWYYERANTELIRRAIDHFEWVTALSNVNNDEKVYLIFTSQPNLVIESGIPSSLHSNCHDQIVFAKLKFNLSIFYPPPYERTVWYYERANTELIRRAIDHFEWVTALSNVNNDEKVYFFTETLLNII